MALEYSDTSGVRQWTYQQLNGLANRLAHYLVSQGVTSGTLVGVCVERSPQMIVAILAVLKAGGAYVPLNPSYPSARLQHMLSDTDLKHLLTQSTLIDALSLASDVKVTLLDA